MNEKKSPPDYLKLQLEMKGESVRLCNIMTVVVLVLIVFGFALAGVLIPDKETSDRENRKLAQRPSMSSEYDGSFIDRVKNGKFLDKLFDGSYTSELSEYMSDQFPMRNAFVSMKSALEIAQLKRENNGVTLARDGYIIKREDYPSTDNLDANLDAISNFSAAMDARGVKTVLAVAGRNEDVLGSKLPGLYPRENSERLWKNITDGVAQRSIDFVNLRDPLKSLADDGEYVYYKTDHHWTTRGAYAAYTILSDKLGITPLSASEITVETASSKFYGTTWSSAGMQWVAPDTLEYYRYRGDTEFVVDTGDSSSPLKGFYDYSYLDVRDKYSSFLGGNHALVTVRASDGHERPKLLIVKDSFAHSISPFLAYNFDLDIIDPRYYKSSIADYVDQNGISAVLILNNAASLTDSSAYTLLNAGLK